MSSESEPVMIDDPRVVAIEIVECGEPLVDVATRGLATADGHPRATSTAKTRFHCRELVADKLEQVNASLGEVDLVLAEGHRPIALQRLYWETTLAALAEARPELTGGEVAQEAAKFVAPPDIVPPHSTGGAVDVILRRGADTLSMGSELNEQCEAMRTAYPDIGAEHRKNRRLLVDSMEAVGFINYGHEWWHYSYGDRYWGFATGSKAIYDAL